MSTSIFVALGVLFLLVIVLGALFFKQVKGLICLIFHTVFGWAGLYILNLLLASYNFSIGINIASATIAGVLGIPGVALMASLNFIY